MNRRLIEVEWEKYRRDIPPNVPSFLVKNMKNAYYAGAATFYATLIQNIEVQTEPNISIIYDLYDELYEYNEESKKGAR